MGATRASGCRSGSHRWRGFVWGSGNGWRILQAGGSGQFQFQLGSLDPMAVSSLCTPASQPVSRRRNGNRFGVGRPLARARLVRPVSSGGAFSSRPVCRSRLRRRGGRWLQRLCPRVRLARSVGLRAKWCPRGAQAGRRPRRRPRARLDDFPGDPCVTLRCPVVVGDDAREEVGARFLAPALSGPTAAARGTRPGPQGDARPVRGMARGGMKRGEGGRSRGRGKGQAGWDKRGSSPLSRTQSAQLRGP